MNGPYLLQFDNLFHNPNPAIDEYLHGDHTHTDEDGNEVTSPGTPDRPVVIDPEPDPDPDPPNANPGPAPDAAPQQAGEGMIDPLTKEKLDALTQPAGVTTGGVFRGGAADEFIFDGARGGARGFDPSQENLVIEYGVNTGDEQLYGGDGNDVLVGGRGDDYLNGGPGNDYLFGAYLAEYDYSQSPGNEHIPPISAGFGSGADILIGGPGNDYLFGGGRIEILNGGPGNDHLETTAEIAALIGGPGRDVFEVTEGGRVKITDFQDGADKILLVRGDRNGYTDGPTEYLALYNLAARAGVQIDMGWIATEVDDGVILPLDELYDGNELTIEGAYLHNLQFELVNGDLFIV